MKNIIKRCASVILTFVMLVSFTATTNIDTVYAASNVEYVPISVQYGQTEARSIFNMINEMRASGTDAWCWDATNTEKVDYSGAQPLTYSYTLEKLAMKRAAEIALSYSHTRPSGDDCFSIYDEEGVTWRALGENIAVGYTSAVAVNDGWREDDKDYAGQGHRRNMLSSNYNCVGIGHVYYNGTHYWVEEFANTTDIGSVVAANDSQTQVNVGVAEEYVLDLKLDVIPHSEDTIYVGDTIRLPEIVFLAKFKDNWSQKNSYCPLDYKITYSLATTDKAILQGDYLIALAPGDVDVIADFEGIQNTLTYKILPVGDNDSNTGKDDTSKKDDNNTSDTNNNQNIDNGNVDIVDIEDTTPVVPYKINKKSASVKKGKKLTLKVTGYKGSVQWTSGNKKVATVNKNGVVTAKKKGTATIKAYCPALGKTVSCKVEVYDKISQANVTKKILKLKSQYYEGMPWDNSDYYFWSAINCHCYGCIGFAGIVSDYVFGKNAKVTKHSNFSKIKPGDHVRIGGYHSVIVMSKNSNSITVTEGNYNSSIHWGRTISKSELQSEGFYVETRY